MSTSTPAPAPDASASEGEDEEGRTRLPRVVVRMSDAMKAALDTWCKDHDVVATQLGRELLAAHIGFDLANDPDAPGGTTRTKYADEAAREVGKRRNRMHSSLLRKSLYQVHQGQMKKRPALTEAATKVVLTLSAGKPTVAELEALEKTLDAAMEAGR